MSYRLSLSRSRGFTLIELLAVVAIIGILSAIALPAYGKYLVRGNRAAAQAYLLALTQAQAQYFADAHTYATTTDALHMPPPDQVAANYKIVIDASDGPPPSFTITATPTGSRQLGDSVLTIDNSGARTPSSVW
jgi:type IV pilus assembly protein PilE